MSDSIGFLSDSTIDLPEQLLEKHHIATVPLRVFMDGADYRDGADITTDQMYAYADRTKSLPKTSAVHIDDFAQAYCRILDGGGEVIYAGLSGELSSTYQNACIARDKLGAQGYDPARIHLVDSRQLSTGIAQLVLYGCELAKAGLPASEIAARMGSFRQRVNSSFILDTLEYLHMGGRCSSLQLIASNVLRIHPQIDVTDGKLVPTERYRGSLTHCIKQYFERTVARRLSSIEPKRIFITHTCRNEQVQSAREMVESLDYFEEIIDTQAGATIASHCGPGTLGFLFVDKDE